MDYTKWLTTANAKIANDVQIGSKFEIKALFPEYEWGQLTKGDRISFGKFFANEVREGKIPYIRAVEKNKNNHSQYIKIGEQL